MKTFIKRRARDQEKSKKLFEKLSEDRLPHSLGQYGRNGMRSYSDGFHPPWLVHLIAEIATGFENIKIFQAECDKDYAIMTLANRFKCPIISNDSDFLLYAVAPVIRLDFNWAKGLGSDIFCLHNKL